MMLNYCSDTLSLKNRIDFPRTFRIKKESDISIEIYRFRIFFFSEPCYSTISFFAVLPSMMV